MKLTTRISHLISFSASAEAGPAELSTEDLALVFGASGATSVPPGAPQYPAYKAGEDLMAAGSKQFIDGAKEMALGAITPPPADLILIPYGAYNMGQGATTMDQGEAQRDAALGDYNASISQPPPPPPPPEIITIDPVVITGDIGGSDPDVVMMDPLIVTPNGGSEPYY